MGEPTRARRGRDEDDNVTRTRARYKQKRGQQTQEQSRRRSLCYESDFLVISDHKEKVFLFYLVQALYSEVHEAAGDYQNGCMQLKK